jgi:uncharacterized Zn finger protein
LSERDWVRVEHAMASKAIFMAKLLAGEMPRQIEEAFSASKLSLFPASGRQLSSSCTCPDLAVPCKHVAAVFYILAEALDADPFLVFKWRGRTKEELLDNLGALRASAPASEEAVSPAEVEPQLSKLVAKFWKAGPQLAAVQIRPWTATSPDELVRGLGPVGVTVRGQDLGEVLAESYRVMSAAAQRLALGDAADSDGLPG